MTRVTRFFVMMFLAAAMVSCQDEQKQATQSAAKFAKTVAKSAGTISAGGYHTVGLKSGGTVVAVGKNTYTDYSSSPPVDKTAGQLDVDNWRGIGPPAAKSK